MTLEQRSDSAAAGHEACDQPIRSLEILNQCVPLFETLKDPNRQQLLVQLVCHGPQTVGELAESSALSRTAVSHHIKLLEQAGRWPRVAMVCLGCGKRAYQSGNSGRSFIYNGNE